MWNEFQEIAFIEGVKLFSNRKDREDFLENLSGFE